MALELDPGVKRVIFWWNLTCRGQRGNKSIEKKLQERLPDGNAFCRNEGPSPAGGVSESRQRASASGEHFHPRKGESKKGLINTSGTTPYRGIWIKAERVSIRKPQGEKIILRHQEAAKENGRKTVRKEE